MALYSSRVVATAVGTFCSPELYPDIDRKAGQTRFHKLNRHDCVASVWRQAEQTLVKGCPANSRG